MIAGRYRYVAIEGPIGAGKTSLATQARRSTYGAHTLLEKPEANPFLERFYRDRARYALPTQLFFLFQRVQQLAELRTARPVSRSCCCSPISCSTRIRCLRA